MCARKGIFMSGSLDNLAASGVINFDADAYIKGTPPRYAGPSENYLPFDKPLFAEPQFYGIAPGEHMQGSGRDAFVTHDKKQSSGPTFKQVLAGLLATGLAGFAAFKLFFNTKVLLPGEKGFIGKSKEQLNSFLKSEKVKNVEEKAKETTKGFFAKCKELFAKGKEKLGSLFESKEAKKAREAAKRAEERTRKVTKGLKAAGVVLAGILGLYGLYTLIAKPKNKEG